MSDFVALNYVEEYDIKTIEQAVRTSFLNLNLQFKPKMKILVKVNIPNAVSKDNALTTNPAVVSAVVNVLNSFGAKCIVADSPYKNYSADYLDQVYFETGMLEMANNSNCELNHNLKTFECQMPDGVRAKSLLMLDVLNQVDAIVNIGKVKMDEVFGYLGACSNLFGLLPGEYKTLVLNRLNCLADYNNLLIDIAQILKSKIFVNVLDGIVALEAGNSQRLLSCLAIGQDVFKLDAAMLKIIGIPFENSLLQQAEERGQINLKYPFKLLGEDVNKFKVEDFALYEFNNQTLINKNTRQQKAYFKTHQKRVSINPKKCKGCGVCARVCPTDAIMMKYDKNGELFANIDYEKCIFCFKCRAMCPYNVVDFKTPLSYKTMLKQIEKQNLDVESKEKEKH